MCIKPSSLSLTVAVAHPYKKKKDKTSVRYKIILVFHWYFKFPSKAYRPPEQ